MSYFKGELMIDLRICRLNRQIVSEGMERWGAVFSSYPTTLPAVCDLTRDGRLSTYDESVLKLSRVSFR